MFHITTAAPQDVYGGADIRKLLASNISSSIMEGLGEARESQQQEALKKRRSDVIKNLGNIPMQEKIMRIYEELGPEEAKAFADSQKASQESALYGLLGLGDMGGSDLAGQGQGQGQGLGLGAPSAAMAEEETITEVTPEQQAMWDRLDNRQKAAIGMVKPQLANMLQAESKSALERERYSKEPERDFEKEMLKRNLDLSTEIDKKGSSAADKIKVYDNLEKLVKSGKTGNQLTNYLGKFDALRWMEDPASIAFQAGLKNLFVGFLDTFGSRPAGFEALIFQKGLPDLYATDEGKLAVIEMNRAQDQANVIKKEVKKQILKENKGRPPADLADQIEERSKERIDKLHEDASRKMREYIAKGYGVGENEMLIYDSTRDEFFKAPKDKAEIINQNEQFEIVN